MPAAACAACSRPIRLFAISWLCRRSISASMSTPACSMSSSTRTSGRSMSSYTDARRGCRGDLGPQPLVQSPDDIRVLGCVFRGTIDRHLAERELLRALARDVLEIDRLDAEIMRGRRVEIVASCGAVEHVRLEHRVVAHAGELDAVIAQHVRVVLQVVPDLGARRVLEQGLQCRQHAIPVELRRRAGIVVRERQIGGVSGFAAERHADDLGLHVVERGRLGVEGHEWRPPKPFEPLLERRLGHHRLIPPNN